MESSQDTEIQHHTSSGPGPGAKLKALREAQGLSLDEAWRQSRIPEKKLPLLEADDYEAIGNPVFVSGYLRSYAKLLGADGAALVNEFHALQRAAQSDNESLDDAVEAGGGMNVPMVIGAAAVLFLVVLVFVLSSGGEAKHKQKNLAPIEADIAEADIVEALVLDQSNPVLAQDSQLEPGAELEQTSGPERAEPTQNGDASEPRYQGGGVGDDVGDDVGDRADNRADNSSSDSAELSAEQQAAPQLAPRGQVSQASNTGPAAQSAPAEQGDSANGALAAELAEQGAAMQRQLELSFTDDCWVEVKDGSGKLLFADIQRSGDNLRLFGQAPLNLMLGNARAVSLVVDGESVDVPVRSGRDTARFTLP
ncbi:RodZ domain-containing protein [Agaribacterium haliotis]|uniref:RodZ domain-containing protein n=1 Tax=Agaribacterium haliotis TaxID=2013869 RepID=UPI000BB5832E|nr:RodZ domain-containing protein [Agaribacterium haliotis]